MWRGGVRYFAKRQSKQLLNELTLQVLTRREALLRSCLQSHSLAISE